LAAKIQQAARWSENSEETPANEKARQLRQNHNSVENALELGGTEAEENIQIQDL
jgi:hypothetical protein